jgi:enhancer of mRNA-decapping protein 3
MDEQWIGKGVDLDCGPLGVFQGVINAVHLEEQTITMKNVIHNGVPSKMSSITIEARDIKGIEFIEAQTSANAQARKQATSTITIAKKKTRPVAENLAMNSSNHIRKSQSPAVFGIADHRMSPKKPAEAASGFSAYNKQKGSYHQRDEACFDIDLNSIHSKEFDFEHNLALFDKHRVLQEIESNQPDVVRLIDHNRRGNKTTTSTTTGASKAAATAPPPSHGHRKAPEPKYRNDQNVLSSAPTKVRGIATEEAAVGEYMTDAGLIVPAISYKLRERFMAAAEARGISRERLTELVARAGTELAVQLLGGSRRLNPSNSHQLPLCVILCGPGQTGAYGLAISRHLAAQGVKTLAYLPHLSLYPTHLASELSLYKLCCKGSMCKFTNDAHSGSANGSLYQR